MGVAVRGLGAVSPGFPAILERAALLSTGCWFFQHDAVCVHYPVRPAINLRARLAARMDREASSSCSDLPVSCRC